MKKKPVRHKETNTFKFKPFSERVTQIDVDIFHRVSHRNEEDSEDETHFYQAMQKWNVLNLSESYSSFKKEIGRIVTLPQLLNSQQEVINTLIKYLKLKDPLCLQTVLELIVAVARDLQKEFYPHFSEFLTAIIDLLYTKDAEQLEYTFTTLAYLFKFLWRYLIRNVDKVFSLLLPLLSESRPHYINNFAAESFAFVVRKVKDKESFLGLVLRSLEETQNGVSGCGKLLFEVVSGITGQFHSCAEQLLSFYFESLDNESFNQDLLYQVLTEIVKNILGTIHYKKCDVLWTVILRVMDKFIERHPLFDKSSNRKDPLILILRLVFILIEQRGGKMVKDPVIVARKLADVIGSFENNLVILEEVLQNSTALLLAVDVNFSQEIGSYLVLKILSIQHTELLLENVEKLISFTSFETLILPRLLKMNIEPNLRTKFLRLLAKIITVKAPPSLNGTRLQTWNKFTLNVREKSVDIDFLLKNLESLSDDPSEEKLHILLILPHLNPLQEKLKSSLMEVIVSVHKKISNEATNSDLVSKLSFSFLLALDSLVHILSPDEFYNFITSSEIDLLDLTEKHKTQPAILNSLDLTLTYVSKSQFEENLINDTTFDKLHKFLAGNLCSENPKIRMTVAHIFSLFSNVRGIKTEVENKGKDVFELIYLAENEPASVHTYRNKLLHLQALTFEGQALNSLDPSYYDIPLYYLISNLYLNFSLIWEPSGNILATYATKQCPQFWPIFLSQLQRENVVLEPYISTINCDVLSPLEISICANDEKVDHENYKLLLWKSMSNFPDYCETKNRDLTVMFIDFVEKSVFKSNTEDGKSCSIEKRKELEEEMDVEDEEDVKEDEENNDDEEEKEEEKNNDEDVKEDEEKNDDEEEKDEEKEDEEEEEKDDDKEEDEEKDDDKEEDEDMEKYENEEDSESVKEKTEIVKRKSKKSFKKKPEENKEPHSKMKIKLLLAQMQIFTKTVNPKSLYRESEMCTIYLDLLASKNAEIQRAALNCLLAYKHKYLLPYKDHLSNFVDEKQLKGELTRFKITKEESMIEDSHRDDLFPILMRIIYAKMTTRVGMRTGGKAGGLLRRKMILRFLAGAEEKEMFTFVQMAFKPFLNRLLISVDESVDLKEFVNEVIASVDLMNVTPPKRLQSAVNLLAILIEQFGGKMTNKLLPHLLKILLTILAQVKGILDKSEHVHSGFLSTIRNVRTNSINILARFFVHFENYRWTTSEIDALFEVAVFPWLEKLPLEGVHSPTPLLKMFLAWSQNPRYYALLIKHKENDENFTPLVYILQLLLRPKTHSSVANTILEMIEKMLTLLDHDKTNQDPNAMEVDEQAESLNSIASNILEINFSSLPKGINYGSAILLSHVSSILEFMRRKLEKSKKHNRGVRKTELVVLSRISEFVTDGETSDTLLSLIVPILAKKASLSESEDVLIHLLTIVSNLVKQVEKPEQHLRIITPLIGSISGTSVRKQLIGLFNTIASRSSVDRRESMIRDFDLLTALNSWDSRWVDQPDVEKRLNTFVEIKSLNEKNEVSLEFGVAVIYNCFFFLKTDNDLAIRDTAGECLKAVGKKLAFNHKDNPVDRRYLIDDTILGMLRKSIRSKEKNVRYDSISFLGYMALECPEVHPVLRDLNLLTNKQDPEVDFFQNLLHLQLHRKVRALLKFCTLAKTLHKPLNTKTLIWFILPLASSFLCTESFLNKNTIVDAAVEVVATVCRLLPWHQYEIILKFYLDKLRHSHEFQKQIIKIIVPILDAFHFDLSKYKDVKPLVEDSLTSDVLNPEENNDKSFNLEETLVNGENDGNDEENLDEALNKESEVAEEEEKSNEKLPIIERETVLSSYMAKRLIFNISRIILPQLNRSIMARTQHENSHKINRRRTGEEREEEELMRVPVALALVKLLQKLPDGMMNSNLPGIFMKICTFLKSRLESVRRTTREVLQKIMITLGPGYLHYLLREMNTLLTKGFQIHVLVFTIQSVLVALKPYLQPVDANKNLTSILSVCKVDLFGLTAEEKEVAGIIRNVSEAKQTKSYDIFHIMAQFISESCLIDIIMPLKEVLIKSHSHKTLYKVGECLRQISLGLADNNFIETKSMLIFLYGVVSESIPDLLAPKEKKLSKEEIEAKARAKAVERPDIFIIPPVPKREKCVKSAAKTTINTSAHFLVEFGLRLIHIFLKRDKFNGVDFKSLLNPFVPILNDGLKSQHVKINTLSVQCLNWVVKMDLPAVHELISEICTSIFSILHKYAVADLSKGDNYNLVTSAFKCTSVIVRDVKHFTISEDQLKLLIIYAEQDLHDSEKQATAYGLLKAIINRKMIAPELNEVMKKVSEIIVISELDHVRQQSRLIFYSYLTEYPLGKKIKEYIVFFLNQLTYELQPGRVSVIEMLHSIVKGFPVKILIQYANDFFYRIGARIIKDEDPDCKKLCQNCIQVMLERLPIKKRNELFGSVINFMKDENVGERSFAVQLCGVFVLVEKEKFEPRLEVLLPLLVKQFYASDVDESAPGRFVRLKKAESKAPNAPKNTKETERQKDHHYFRVLTLLLKLSTKCTAFLKDKKYKVQVDFLAGQSHSLLKHPHLWVRVAASQFLGFILSVIDIEKLEKLLNNPDDSETGYIYSDPVHTLRSLTLDLIDQLYPEMNSEEFSTQVIKNLVFIARVLKNVNIKIEETEEVTGETDKSYSLSLLWLVKRMKRSVNIEVTQCPKSIAVRSAVFKWIAAIISTIPIETLQPLLFQLMSPLVREMTTTEESNATLRQLAKEVSGIMKKKLDSEEYVRLLSRVQQKIDARKSERKKIRKQQVITDPELAAKRKIAKQQKKKVARKRKMETLKGKRMPRKKPRKEVDLEAE